MTFCEVTPLEGDGRWVRGTSLYYLAVSCEPASWQRGLEEGSVRRGREAASEISMCHVPYTHHLINFITAMRVGDAALSCGSENFGSGTLRDFPQTASV